jgi:hypothetical protein
LGAKTGLLVYADGDVSVRLKGVGTADLEQTSAMMLRLYPGWTVEPAAVGSNLREGVYPPDGRAHAASWPGVELLCDRRVMVDRPSQLPDELVAASAGRRMVLHAMHSVVDWLAFGVWEDGRLIRSLSLSPDSGIVEDIGEPLPRSGKAHSATVGRPPRICWWRGPSWSGPASGTGCGCT